MKLFPGARYSIDIAIEVATSKYLDHQPLFSARENWLAPAREAWTGGDEGDSGAVRVAAARMAKKRPKGS